MSVRRAQDERIEGTPDGFTAISEIMDVPDAPTIGAATNVGTSRAYNNGSATVAFTAPATGGTPTSYTATSTPGSFTASGASSPLTVTGLQSQTGYTFAVTSTNSAATSPASSSTSSITATTVPQAPTIGTATVTNSTNVSVAFTPGATGGSAITSYTVTSSPGSFTGTGSSSPVTVNASFVAATAYTFTVTATNANGTSTASSASNSVTPLSITYWAATGNDGASAAGQNSIGYGIAANSSSVYSTGSYQRAGYSVIGGYGVSHNTDGSSSFVRGFNSTVTSPKTGNPTGSSYIYGAAIDSSNNGYSAGRTDVVAGVSNATLNKHNSSGTLQWSRMITNINNQAVYYCVATDSTYVYAAGHQQEVSPGGTSALIVKYDTSGNIQWQRKLIDDKGATGYPIDYAYGIAADSSGNVYVAGALKNSNDGTQPYLVKYNSSGTLQWQVTITSGETAAGQNGTAYALALDSSGNPHITGSQATSAGSVVTGFVIKYNSSGTLQWQRTFIQSSGIGKAITVDSSGNVYAAGTAYDNTLTRAYGTLIKYNSSGTLQWQRILSDAAASSSPSINGIATDSAGTIYVTGQFRNSSQGGQPFMLHLPADGSKTGTITIVSGVQAVYSAGSLTVGNGSYTAATSTFLTSSTPTYTESATTQNYANDILTVSAVTI